MRAHHRCLLNHDRCRHTADERSNERMHLGILQLFVHHGAINARLAVSAHGFNRGSLRIRLHSHRNWQCVALMAGRSSTQFDGIVSMGTDTPSQRHSCKR